MKKRYLLLVPVVVFLTAEVSCKIFLFSYYTALSHRLNKGYYRFSDSKWEYFKHYLTHLSGYDDAVIVKDIYNRRFYKPGVHLQLGKLGEFRSNAWGMNERDISEEKEKELYRIICVGSSYSLSGSPGKRFTDILEKKLNASGHGRRFEVINAAVSGQEILDSLITFALSWRQLNPDMIIIDNVLDDVPNAVNPFYLRSFKDISGKKAAAAARAELLRRYSGIYALADLIKQKRFRRYTRPAEEGLAFYESTLEALVLLAKGMNSRVVLLSCGIRCGEDNLNACEEKIREELLLRFPRFSLEAVTGTIGAYNAIMERVAQKNEVIFIDMSAVVPKDEKHYFDATHRSDRGNDVFAGELMERFLELDAF